MEHRHIVYVCPSTLLTRVGSMSAWELRDHRSGDNPPMLMVVDAGLGNIGSVANMLQHIGAEARVATSPTELTQAAGLVLPGVGAFDQGMSLLSAGGWIEPLGRFAASGRPVLGICLGMQLMTRRSDEGTLPGLGWMQAETRSFDRQELAEEGLRLPHMGWSDIHPVGDDPLFPAGSQRFYFVHSYRVCCDEPTDVRATCRHGQEFVAAFRRGNLIGVQFHPEKSHRYGMDMFRRFAEMAR